jgi:hypothetical protein
MGEKIIGFVEKVYDFAKQNPNLVSSYLEIAVFGVDFGGAHGLWMLHNMILQLKEGISNTEMVAESEAYQAALVFYKFVKMVVVQDIPGAREVYKEPKTCFLGGKRRAEGLQMGEMEAIKKEVKVS